jgi:hypothetical protein
MYAVIFVLPALFFSRSPLEFSMGAIWMQYFITAVILLMASLLILLWQYSRRRTAVTRMMAAVTMILILGIPKLLPVSAMMAMQVRLSESKLDASQIQIRMDPTRTRPRNVVTGGGLEGTVQIDIPIQVTPLADDMDLYTDILTAEIEGPGGKVSHAAGTILRQDDGFWQKMYVDLDDFRRLKEEPVSLRSSVYFTILADQQTTRIVAQEKGTPVPGLGICRFSQRGENWTLACFSPFRRPSVFAKTFLFDRTHTYTEPGSYSPYPAEAVINPLVISARGNGSFSGKLPGPLAATIVTEVSMGHYNRDFEIRGLVMGDFAVRGSGE